LDIRLQIQYPAGYPTGKPDSDHLCSSTARGEFMFFIWQHSPSARPARRPSVWCYQVITSATKAFSAKITVPFLSQTIKVSGHEFEEC